MNIVIHKDNSGTYTAVMGLEKMFAMINQVGGESNDSHNRTQTDSTILLNSLVMAADNLREQEMPDNFSIVLQKLRAFDQLTEKVRGPNRPDEQIAGNSLAPAGVVFRFSAKKGRIQNQIIDTKGIENYLNNDSAITALKGMVPMMVDMMNRTTISTAGKIKKYSGNNAGLSDDKKTVTFQYSFTDILEHPEKMAFSRQVQVID